MSSAPEEETRPKRFRLFVVLVFVLIAVLFVAQVPGVLLVNPDSAVYMALGRSLARGGGYRFNFQPYAKYPPVYPAMLAAVYATAGESIRAMQTLTALAGVGALVAAYALVKARAGRGPALGVAVLTAACTWFQSHASVHIRADVPYTMFAMVALWYAERQIRSPRWSWLKWAAVALLATVALYTHLAGAALVAAVGAGALFSNERSRPVARRIASAALVGALAAAAVAYWLHRGSLVANPTANYSKHTTLLPVEQMGKPASPLERASKRLQEWARAPLSLDDDKVTLPVAAVLLGLLVVPGLAAGFRRPRSAAEFYVVAHFAISYVGGGPTGHERYVLPVVPLLFYYGYVSLRLWGRAIGGLFRSPGAARVLPRALVATAAVLALVQGITIRARCKRGAAKLSPKRRERDRRRVAAWQRAGERVRRAVGDTDAVVYPGSGNTWAKLHYFSGCRLGEVWYTWDIGVRCLRQMRDQGAQFVFDDVTNAHCRRRLDPLLRDHPQCFRRLDEYNDGENHWVLYRLDREQLQKVLAAIDRPPKP